MPAGISNGISFASDPGLLAGPASWALLLLWLASVYGVASVLCFAAYALDKAAAVRGERRIAERTLLLLGFACGWPGGWLAQRWLRHKTRKAAFQRWYWASVVLNMGMVAWLLTTL